MHSLVDGHDLGVDAIIETAEYKLLCHAVLDACRELRFGKPDTGRQYLLEGLNRVSEYAESGAAWGDTLADEYRRALSQFDDLADPYMQHTRELAQIVELLPDAAARPVPKHAPRANGSSH